MLGLLNTVLSKGNTLLTYVKDGLVMANRFLTPPKLTFPVDASAEFNGTSDYIDTGLTGSEFPIDTFSFSFWLYMDALTSTQNIVSIDKSDAGTLAAFYVKILTGTQQFRFDVVNSANAAKVAQTTQTFNTNEWYHLAGTFNGTDIKLFVNGSNDGNGTFTGTLPTPTGNMAIGASYYNGSLVDWWPGNLANVAIWNRALTSDEINSVMWKTYEQVSTTEKSGLQAWYKLSADEVLSDDSTATLTTYANANGLTFEAPACVQTALNGLPDITDARLYSANYDIRVSADGGNVESLSCVETELNAIL
jgi:hypothetical protein